MVDVGGADAAEEARGSFGEEDGADGGEDARVEFGGGGAGLEFALELEAVISLSDRWDSARRVRGEMGYEPDFDGFEGVGDGYGAARCDAAGGEGAAIKNCQSCWRALQWGQKVLPWSG